ncbi:thioester reductase domain-containing protein, partial [Streptomyces sp.]|uniref:thioester reductase domain-containing protein n=1 Tax=Streptomyces sp. TaxID=1931 RepID=UPI002F420FDB
VHAGTRPRRVPLPTTPWRGESYWFPDRGEPAATGPGTGPGSGTDAAPGRDVPGVGRRLRTAVPTYELDPAGPLPAAPAGTGEEGNRHLSLGTLAGIAVSAAADALGGTWACVEEIDLLEGLPLGRLLGEPQTLQITVSHGDDGRAVFAYRGLSRAEEEAGAPWRLLARGVLRHHPAPAAGRPAPLGDLQAGELRRAADGFEYGPAVVSEAHRGAAGVGGVLVALDPALGGDALAGVLDASVAALLRDADRDRPDADRAGSASHVRHLTCPDPALVRYVRATAVPRTGPDGPPSDEAAGAVDFFAEDGRHIGGIGELRVAPVPAGPPRQAAWRRPEELLSRVEWQPSPLPDLPLSPAGQSWLLLPDRGGAAARLAAELRERGAHCLLADPDLAGTDPAAVGALLTRWRTEAETAADAGRGAEAGRAAGDGPALRVVVCTALDAPLPEEAEPGLIEEYRDRTELTAVTVVQGLLATARPGERVPVSLVTRGTQAAGAARPVDPFGAALWGLGRVLALEHPEFWGGAVDLGPLPEDGGDDGADEASLLLAALTDPGEDQQALRGADRYVARLVSHPLTAEEQRARPVLRSGATYLVTGAFGGIGQAVSRWLASAGADRLVLLGRTPLPDRADRDASGLSPGARGRLRLVRDLEAMGVTVDVAVADVADPVAMRRVVEELSADGRPLRGVVHAAGVQVPQFLRDIPVTDPGDYDAVWRPKVIGGWLLHQLTDGLDLDFFVNFSSIAATWGSQHLTAYAAANAFLDALAEHRHAGGLRALTVSWGPWDLPSNLFGDDVLAFLTATGLRPLAAPQCLRLLGALLAGTAPHAVVCAADWQVYKPVMEARAEQPLLRTVELPEEEAGPGAGPLLGELATAGEPAGRLALLVPYLRDVLGEVLAVPGDTLLPESDVFAHGLDSLMVMEVVKRCKQDLRVTLRPHQFFERTTLEDWAVLLSDATAGSGTRGGGSSAPVAAPGTLASWADPARIAEDVVLDPAIRPGTPLPTGYTAPREVLLTGATGFLGAHLLDELLATTDATVYCLVRCAGPEQGLDRIRENAERYLPWRPDADRRIVVLPGDLARPLLGLDEARFDALADRLDAIYHNGALVNFSHTYEQSRPANVAGTEEILRLACRGRLTPVSHVSTYGIWGLPADGRTVITEDDPIGGAGKLVTGYVQSKWAAERLVELARERGVPVDVHRPGRVLGHSRTGACLTTHFTTRVIKGCVQLGLAPALDLEIEMTPVDYVARALVRISREEHRFGATYHLVNRHRMRFRDLVAVMAARGWRIETVATDTWWAALRASFAGQDAAQDNALHPVMEVVEEFVVGGEEAIDYDAARAEHALLAAGISCPPLDRALLDTYFDWLIHTGYLPDPDPSSAPGH